jgi:uncharacterized protein YndB with AHSA1/START domain
MISFEATTRINRPIEDVFQFVADGRNAAQWNSAVKNVWQTSDGPVRVGTTYRMVRELPQGRVENTYSVIEYIPNRKLSIQTTSGPTPFVYRYSFKPVASGTELALKAEVDLGAVNVLAPIAGRAIKRGVEANFSTLKRRLEA